MLQVLQSGEVIFCTVNEGMYHWKLPVIVNFLDTCHCYSAGMMSQMGLLLYTSVF